MNKLKEFILRNKFSILLVLIFTLHIFFRFYELEGRAQFTWDQVDNAWVSKNMIINHKFPLLGMVAKQDTGVFIGPAYYYLATFFYLIFDLDPIASPTLAGVTSIFTFFILFYITKRLFSLNIALMAVFIHTVSFHVIGLDRVQWPVNFIAPISLIIFYALYNIILGNAKYLLLLSFILGLSFHIHFTSVLYLLIILLSLPLTFFINKNLFKSKELLRYSLLSIPLFLIWFVPNIIAQIQYKNEYTTNFYNFIQSLYHGIHLKRILQVAKEAFIEFEAIFTFPMLKILKYLPLPLFSIIYFFEKTTKKRFILVYLTLLWFLVPWLVFSVYRGEISNYYFSLTRPFVMIILSYITFRLFQMRGIFPKMAVIAVLFYYSYQNMHQFFTAKYQGLDFYKKKMFLEAKYEEKHQFTYGAPESYLFYYYTRKLYGKQ